MQGHVPVQADTSLVGVPEGTGSVNLTGIASNCTVRPSLPLAVTVSASQSVDVGLIINCAAPSFLHLSVQTTGQDFDPDGYFYTLDAGAAVAIGNEVRVIPVGSGSHTVTLGGFAANCGGPSSVLTQNFDGEADTAQVSFNVDCTPTTGSILLTMSTTGALPDPDGYLVTIENGPAAAMGVNDTHLFNGLAPGSHKVVITGIAPNCSQYLPDQVTAIVGAGPDPLAFTLPVDCPEVGTLRVETPVLPQVLNGYAIFIGDDSHAIGATDTTIIPNIPVGVHPFSVRILENGCIATPNGGTVSIAANQFTDLQIECPAAGTLRVETPVISQTGTEFAIQVGDSWYLLGTSDTTVIQMVPVGTYPISLIVPAGCAATPDQGDFTVVGFAFTDLQISLSCPAASAALKASAPGSRRAVAMPSPQRRN